MIIINAIDNATIISVIHEIFSKTSITKLLSEPNLSTVSATRTEKLKKISIESKKPRKN